jgi:hypothetical protein
MSDPQPKAKHESNARSAVDPRTSGTAASTAYATAVAVKMPAPTAWPFILAFGVTLIFAGLLTSAAVTTLGVILATAGAVGWFCQVLPLEQHETVQATTEVAPAVTDRLEVMRIKAAPEMQRAWLPIEIYPVSAGVKGGLAGGVAMAVLASAYGLISHGSVWYPINLLASIVYAQPFQLSEGHLTSFHMDLLLVATAIHLVTSLLVGLLYGVLLPMVPRRPILLGGFIAPVVWSGLLYTSLGIINPLLNQRIHWMWFVASQIAFGVVAGIVVARQERVRTRQHMPLAARAGIETPGIVLEKGGRSDES